MDTQTLDKYQRLFAKLHRNIQRGLGAPHKPILLLSVLDEIERGHITENQIELSVDLVAAFRENWVMLRASEGNWQERVWLPFRHLRQEGFWQLVKAEQALSSGELGQPNSVPDMRRRADYAQLSPDLWLLLQDPIARTLLRQHLLQTYFDLASEQMPLPLSPNPLDAQLQRLIAESQRAPRRKETKLTENGTAYYVRHNLFPQIIRALYVDTCAVCGVHARIAAKSVIEAAHIKPFADFHDDHPSNGLALCRDHHWGFDEGAFTITDEYTVLVSPQLKASPEFLTPGRPIQLPSSENCYPALDSLAHHREHRFRR